MRRERKDKGLEPISFPYDTIRMDVRLFIIYFFTLLFLSASGQELLCPISASLTISQSQMKETMDTSTKRSEKSAVLHNYPLDIFSRSQLARAIVHNRSSPSIMWCRASDSTESSPRPHLLTNRAANRLHTCSPLTYCPILPSNVITAQKSITAVPPWKVYSSFCSFKQRLDSSQPVNIIILGGSVTLGVGSTGCCCSRSHDKRCPYLSGRHPECEYVKRTSRTSYPIPVYYCTWHGYLSRYLQGKFPATNIQLINLAKGGVSSGNPFAPPSHHLYA